MHFFFVLMAIFGLELAQNASASVIVTMSGNGSVDLTDKGAVARPTDVHFRTTGRQLYRPSGSTPWDEFGLENAYVTLDLSASLDTPLRPFIYEGNNAMFAELAGQVHIASGRYGEGLDFTVLATVLFYPSPEGTDVLVRPIVQSGESPSGSYRAVNISYAAPDEFGSFARGISLNVKGGLSRYEFDFQSVVDQADLSVMSEMAAARLVYSHSNPVESIRVGSSRPGFHAGQSYLPERPSAPGAMTVYFSTSPVPEPCSSSLGLVAGLTLAVGRRRFFATAKVKACPGVRRVASGGERRSMERNNSPASVATADLAAS